jgi:hypothetical protein
MRTFLEMLYEEVKSLIVCNGAQIGASLVILSALDDSDTYNFDFETRWLKNELTQADNAKVWVEQNPDIMSIDEFNTFLIKGIIKGATGETYSQKRKSVL